MLRDIGVLFVLALGVLAIWFGGYNAAREARTTPIAKPLVKADQNSERASRARYLNARGTLDRAWGDWNVLFVRSDMRHELIVGMSAAECTALRRNLEPEVKWITACYSTTAP